MVDMNNMKLASSRKYFMELWRHVQRTHPKTFLDMGCGTSNKLGRFIAENSDAQVFVSDAQDIEALGGCSFIDFEDLKQTNQHFDIIHASCLFHEICAPGDFEHRESKGGPHTVESMFMAELMHRLLAEDGTLIIEDFVSCSFDEFLDEHYFLKTIDKIRYGALFDRLYISLFIEPNEKSAASDLSQAGLAQHIALMSHLFFSQNPVERRAFRHLEEFEKILHYLRRYKDHHIRHKQEDYERLFIKAGFAIEKVNADSALTRQWFCKKL